MFDGTLTKMATFGENRAMSFALSNHNLFISGQDDTGKTVLLRIKPKKNAYFYPSWPYMEFVILTISAIQEHLVFYPSALVLQSKRLILQQ